MQMTLGLIRERKNPPDQRAVLSPSQCTDLLHHYPSLRILVEPSEIRAFANQDYVDAGCQLTDQLSDADWLLGVKEVPVDHLHPGKTHFFFSHTYKRQPSNRDLLKACVDKGVRLIDWELLKHNHDRVIGFGVYAGLVGAYEALRGYGMKRKEFDLSPALKLGTVSELKRSLQATNTSLRAAITGSGRVASGARDMLLAAGLKEVSPEAYLSNEQAACFTVLPASAYVQRSSDGGFNKGEFYQRPDLYRNNFLRFARCTDLYLACHYWKDGSPPFFTAEDACHPDFNIQFVGDISCDIDGPVACTLRPSTADSPFYGWNPQKHQETDLLAKGSIGVLAVDNLPSQVPMDATEGFGKAFIEQVLKPHLRGEGEDMLWQASECANGSLTNKFKHLAGYMQAMDLQDYPVSQWESLILQSIQGVRDSLETLANQGDEPTFRNTVLAMEQMGHVLDQHTSVLFNANSACTTPEIQRITQAVSAPLSELGNDIMSHPKLFHRMDAVMQSEHGLGGEDLMLLKRSHSSFVRNGALLPKEKQAQLKTLSAALAKATLTYSEQVLADSESWFMAVTEAELEGLPESAKTTAAQAALDRNLDASHAITLDAPTYVAVMTYAKDGNLREQLYRAFAMRCNRGDGNDNNALMAEIANLRMQRAQLLGYDSHADYVLEDRMAKNPATVHGFLANLLDVAMPEARKEWSDLQTFAARSLELPEMQRWDLAFVSEQYKQDQLELDSEALKVYFPLNQVLEGAFKVANQLHGLTFVHEADNPSYHEDVDCYEVWNAQGDFVAHLMADWHPRKGKRNGAWMTSYRTAYRENNQEHKPVISMVCNFSKSHGDEPALLTFREVTTLFHEFGHALHGLMGEGSHASLTGTHVLWDFVELPSQIMENWCYQPEALVLFAKHYLTGEPLPDSEVKKIVKAATFLEGMATVRQLSLGFLDLAWHHRSQPVTDGKALEAESMETFNLWNSPAIGMTSTAFSHIFAGGYSSGYYAYKWAEVLDADAFEAFVEAGIFDPDVADRFGQLLKAGGNVDPDVLYRQFRGRDPHVNALLKRAGLMTDHG